MQINKKKSAKKSITKDLIRSILFLLKNRVSFHTCIRLQTSIVAEILTALLFWYNEIESSTQIYLSFGEESRFRCRPVSDCYQFGLEDEHMHIVFRQTKTYVQIQIYTDRPTVVFFKQLISQIIELMRVLLVYFRVLVSSVWLYICYSFRN